MDLFSSEDIHWMKHALNLAQLARKNNEVPVGAVIIKDNIILSEGFNCPIQSKDPTAHAEIQAIRHACQSLKNYRIGKATLYVTLEPCSMCAGAIIQARIEKVVFGTWDPKSGAAGSICNLLQHPSLNHRPQVRSGVLSEECSLILRSFFQQRRSEGNNFERIHQID